MFGVLIAETSRYSNQRKGIKRSERRSVRAFTVGYVTVASRGSRVLNTRGQWRATSNARLHPSLHNSRSLPAPFPSSFPLSRPCRYTVIFYVIPSCPAVGHSCAGARRESMRGLCAARSRRRYSRYVAREKRGAERNARVKKASENFPPSPSSSCPSPFFFLIDPRVPLLPFLSLEEMQPPRQPSALYSRRARLTIRGEDPFYPLRLCHRPPHAMRPRPIDDRSSINGMPTAWMDLASSIPSSWSSPSSCAHRIEAEKAFRAIRILT